MKQHLERPVNMDGWRKLPLAELEALINETRRSAVRQHLSEAEWRRLDRMRKRARALARGAVLS
jgi:hypothetical protein